MRLRIFKQILLAHTLYVLIVAAQIYHIFLHILYSYITEQLLLINNLYVLTIYIVMVCIFIICTVIVCIFYLSHFKIYYVYL